MTDKMRVWSQVDKTNPSDTKQVTQRGGFTAIDANSQFRKATEVFGPIGEGWGVEIKEFQYPMNNTVALHMIFWFEKREFCFDVMGCCKLSDSKDRADEDAYKKAQTDGMTKALSMLGFNHDVFQGKFDDNKYVQQRQAEEASEKWHGPLKKTKLKESLMEYSSKVGKATTTNELKELNGEYSSVLEQTRLDDPIALDGDGADHKGLGAEYTTKFRALKLTEDQLEQPKEI